MSELVPLEALTLAHARELALIARAADLCGRLSRCQAHFDNAADMLRTLAAAVEAGPDQARQAHFLAGRARRMLVQVETAWASEFPGPQTKLERGESVKLGIFEGRAGAFLGTATAFGKDGKPRTFGELEPGDRIVVDDEEGDENREATREELRAEAQELERSHQKEAAELVRLRNRSSCFAELLRRLVAELDRLEADADDLGTLCALREESRTALELALELEELGL